MAFCILRTKKLKSMAAVAGSAMHTFREADTPNADSSRTANNRITGARSSAGILKALRTKLPEKRRSDAVLAIEYLVTASPEFFVDATGASRTRTAYFNAALSFLKGLHGSENILTAALHLDETSPHLVAYVVPLTKDGKLSAKEFLGGRDKLTRLQSDFHSQVGARFDLERGIQGSRAKHQRVKRFYSQLEQPISHRKLSKFDQLAAAIGIETKTAAQLRIDAEAQVGQSASISRQALNKAKKDRADSEDARSQAEAKAVALTAELKAVKATQLQLSQQLEKASAAAETNLRQAIDLHSQNQLLRTSAKQSPVSSTTKDHHVPTYRQPGLAR